MCQVVGDRLYAVTTLAAPRGRVVSASVDRPAAEDWGTIVRETAAVVDTAFVAGPSLLVASTEHAVSRLHRYTLDGSAGQEIALPELGKPAWKQAEEAAETWAFVLWQLGMDGSVAEQSGTTMS